MQAYGQRLFSRRGLLHLLLCGRNQLAVGDKETDIETAQNNIRAAVATLIPRIQLTPCLRGRRPAGNHSTESGIVSQRLSRPQ